MFNVYDPSGAYEEGQEDEKSNEFTSPSITDLELEEIAGVQPFRLREQVVPMPTSINLKKQLSESRPTNLLPLDDIGEETF